MALAAKGFAWQIPVTEVGRQALLLLAFSLNFNAGFRPAHAEGFGRWETRLASCQLQHRLTAASQPAIDQDCLRLRLEQNMEGLLSVRFMAPGRELTFVGSLGKDQRSMHCNGDGGCTPALPLKLSVATVAEAAFDRSGLARGIPRAQLARGECQILPLRINCQAIGEEGESWSATAPL